MAGLEAMAVTFDNPALIVYIHLNNIAQKQAELRL